MLADCGLLLPPRRLARWCLAFTPIAERICSNAFSSMALVQRVFVHEAGEVAHISNAPKPRGCVCVTLEVVGILSEVVVARVIIAVRPISSILCGKPIRPGQQVVLARFVRELLLEDDLRAVC